MKIATIRLILGALVMLQILSASAYAAGKTNLANEQNTKLTVQDQTGIYDGTATLSATLTAAGAGQPPIPNMTVIFTFNGSTYSGTTNSSGVATANVSLSGLNAGNYSGIIEARFPGLADSYKSSSGTANLTVTQAPTTLTVSNLKVPAGSTVTLTATLNFGSISVSDRSISFYVNGVLKGSSNTDGTGTATLDNVSVADLAAGTYEILAKFSPSRGNLAASTGSGTLTITALHSSLTVNTVTGTYGGTVDLQAKLTSSGSNLNGRTITFTFNNLTYTAQTNAGGVATVPSVSIAGFNVGTYTGAIAASFQASGGYEAASGTGDLKVTPATTALSVSNAAGSYGGTISLSATLTSGGSPVNGQTITFSLNGAQVGQAATETNGTATLTNVPLSGINAGSFTGAITANFAASGNYTGSSGPANLTVDKAAATLNVLNATGTYGGSTSLTAALTAGNTALSGMSISFSFHGTSYSGTTDANGTVTINDVSLSGIDAGIYNNYFTAGFTATANYKAGSGSGNLTVSQVPTSLSVDDKQGLLGGSVTLTAALTSSSAGLSGMSVNFKVNGVSKGSALTDAGGKATLNNISLVGLAVGSYTIEASFDPTGGNYAPITGTGTLNVTELPTELVVSSAAGTYGGTVTLKAALTTSGTALEGKTISFTLNGSSYSAQTNSSGVAAVSGASIADIDAGTHTGAITASFTASGGYASASANGDLTVQQSSTVLIVTSLTGTYGGKVDLSAELTSGGNPLSGKSISFKLNGLPVGSAATGTNGVAVLQAVGLSGIDAAAYNDIITAEFTASGNYNSSTGSGNLIVNQAPTAALVPKSTGTYNGKVSLSATLTVTSSGSALSGRTISFKLNGVSKGSAVTDNNGMAVLTDVSIAAIDAGTYSDYIEAVFSPLDGNYAASAGKGPLEVTPSSTSLSLSNVEAPYGSALTLTAALTSSSVGLQGKTINFTINGVSKGSAQTDINGAAALNNVSIAGIEVGTYNNYIGASFSPAGGNYSSSTGSAALKVDALPVSLVVTNASGIYGQTVSLEAALTSSGFPLVGRTITFTFNGSQHSAVTNSSGAATVSSVSLSGIDAGTHTGAITAAFDASGGYAAATASGDLTVEAATTALLVPAVTGTYGETVSLTATLTSGDLPLTGKTVSFKLGAEAVGSVQTDINGKASLTGISLQGYDAGMFNGAINAEFTASGNYASGSASSNLTVNQAPTTLTPGDVSGTYGETVTLTAELNITSSGNKISGQTIGFKLNGTSVGAAETDNNGLAALANVSLTGISVGTYADYIEAVFSPSGGNFASGTGKSQLKVTPASTSLTLGNVETPFGSTVSLTATLSSGATLLSGRTISFTLNGVLKGTAVTGPDGVAVLNNVGLDGIGAGTYNKYIGAGFSPSGDNYSGSSATADLKVNERPTSLLAENITGTFGGSVTLETTLTSSGSPLSGKTISFSVNGNPAGSATTGSNGKATFQFSLTGFNAGFYSGAIKADFTARDGYAAASAKGDLTVQQAPASLIVNKVTGTFGGNVDLTAKLTSGEVPLANRIISFKLNGKPLETAQTGADGVAVLMNVSLSGIEAGTYEDIITAEFAAEGNYNSGTGKGSLTVNQALVTMVVSKATGPYNGKVSLTATLTAASSGSPLSGITLSFKLNNISVGTAVTGADGAATIPDLSIAGHAVGTYNDYIEAIFSPSGGNYAAGTGKGQLEIVLASTSLAVSKVTAVYGSKVTLTAALTSLGLPLSGKTAEFTLNNVSFGTAVTDANGAASKTNVDLTGISVGLHQAYIGANFAEASPYKGSSGTADLEITKASTAVSVLPAEVQYSDQVTLTAVVASSTAQGGLNTAGGSVEFNYQLGNGAVTSLGTVSSSSVVSGCLNFKYTFTCKLKPGTYKILAAFTPADQLNYDGSSNASPYGPLLVEPEDALAEYTGLTYFSTASSTSISVAMTFSATIKDAADDYRGDISKARVEFREVPVGGMFDNGIIRGTNPGTTLPVFLVNPSDQTIGTSSTQPFSRNLSQSEINNLGASFYVYTKVNGCYSKLSDPALITIGIPGNDNISGGGFIVSNSSAGKYRSKAGSKTNFGFTLKYNKSGRNNQGQANIIIRMEDDKIYQIKSNAINSMSVYSIKGSSGKAASFNTKANLTDITNPFNPISLGGSLSLTVEMYDDGENNEKDAIAITLQDPNSGLLYSSNWSGSKTALQTLGSPNGGGNIKVLSSSGLAKGIAEEIIPKEYSLYQNFPNPFNPSTNIQFDLPEDSRVNISIYNILGREVAHLVNDDLPAGKHQAVWNSQDSGGSLASGMYILRITAKSHTSQRSLVSTKKMMLVK